MKNRSVGLVDMGLDSGFDASMAFVQATIQNINADHETPIVDIEYLRSRDRATIVAGMLAPHSVLHVMSHAGHETGPVFGTETDTLFSLEDLAEHARAAGHGLQSATVLVDACKTGVAVWKQAWRDCLQDEVTYIGTSAAVGWHESTVFCSAFYGALFRSKGKGLTPAQQSDDAAKRAIKAYGIVTDRKCPYSVGHHADPEPPSDESVRVARPFTPTPGR